MNTVIIVSISAGVISLLINFFLANKNFKYKDALIALVDAAKDGKVSEEEFQNIVDNVKKELY